MPPSLAIPMNGVAPPPAPTLYDAYGGPLKPPANDPAWQPPHDPLDDVDLAQRARAISREIPIIVTATGWDPRSARRAMEDLVLGLFDAPAQMTDSLIRTDSRTQAALASRLSIFGRPVDFRIPRKFRHSPQAQECLDAFVDAWPTMAAEPVMSELQRWAVMLGFGPAQILWDTASTDYAIPHPLPWHPRYSYYDWQYRTLVAITMDGQEPIVSGDGHWINHAPHGEYRGWMRGAVSAVTPWWIARHYALRDWARFSERHGLPMIKLKTPAVGDPTQQAMIRFQVQNLGQETVFHLPQNPPPALSYDVELMEAKDTEHEGFRMLIEQCNSEITLAILAQTLTTSMPAEGGSSYAAARVHAGVLQGLLEADARALAFTVYQQLARPFAAINFGNADLAPRVVWDVTPYEDAKTKALSFMQLAEAVNFLRVGGFKMNPKELRSLIRRTIPGFDPGRLEAVEPMAVATIGAKAKADKAVKGSGGGERDHHEADARSRVAQLGARFDPRILSRVRANLSADADSDATREALATLEIEHDARKRNRGTARWTW